MDDFAELARMALMLALGAWTGVSYVLNGIGDWFAQPLSRGWAIILGLSLLSAIGSHMKALLTALASHRADLQRFERRWETSVEWREDRMRRP